MKSLFRKSGKYYVNEELNLNFTSCPIKELKRIWKLYVEEYKENLSGYQIKRRNYLIQCQKEGYKEFKGLKLNPPNEGIMTITQKVETFLKIYYADVKVPKQTDFRTKLVVIHHKIEKATIMEILKNLKNGKLKEEHLEKFLIKNTIDKSSHFYLLVILTDETELHTYLAHCKLYTYLYID